jgi:arginine:pyruvate transaminase
MRISHRIAHLTGDGSGGWALYFRARDLKAAGVSVTDLTIGEHDVPTDPAILAAMDASARGGHTGYAALRGTDSLRRAIAARVTARTGVATGPGNVLVTPGGQAALFAAHHLVGEAGARALFVEPYYATYPGTLRAAGLVPVPVPARPEEGFAPRADEIDARAAGAVSLLINSPNNPTGAVYSEAVLRGIAEVCRKRDLWLVSDEVYDTQVWEGAHLSPRALPGMAERVLVVGSMSKSHAMTGSRIGWIVGPEAAIEALSVLTTHTTYGVPGFVQDAAEYALSLGRGFETEVAAPFRRRRDIALRLLAGQQVVRAAPAGGAMYVMLDVRATGLSGEAFAGRLLDEERIAVMPGESFGAAAAGHLRVALTVRDSAFESAFARLLGFAAELAEVHARKPADGLARSG